MSSFDAEPFKRLLQTQARTLELLEAVRHAQQHTLNLLLDTEGRFQRLNLAFSDLAYGSRALTNSVTDRIEPFYGGMPAIRNQSNALTEQNASITELSEALEQGNRHLSQALSTFGQFSNFRRGAS